MKTLIALFIIFFISVGAASAGSDDIYIVKKDGEIWFTNVPGAGSEVIRTIISNQQKDKKKFDINKFLYSYYSRMEHNAIYMRDPKMQRKAKEGFDLLLRKEKLKKK